MSITPNDDDRRVADLLGMIEQEVKPIMADRDRAIELLHAMHEAYHSKDCVCHIKDFLTYHLVIE